MRRDIGYAKEKGLRRVYGDVLVENTTMLQMCAELGALSSALLYPRIRSSIGLGEDHRQERAESVMRSA
jgi:hypothetical protein